MENKDHLLEVIKTLFRYKKYIIYTVGSVAIGAAIIVLLVPVYYESTTIFFPANQDLAMPENIFGTSNAKMEYYGTDEDASRVEGIAESRELAEFLIDKFDLYEVYDIDTSSVRAPYYVMEAFSDNYNVVRTNENSIEISVEDTDPKRAAAMVNSARDKINEIGQRLIKESQAMTMNTFETGFNQREALLADLNDSLQILRERFGIFNTVTQGETMATQIVSVESKMQADSSNLEFYKNQKYSGWSDSVRVISARIAAQELEVKSLQKNLEKYNQGLAQVMMLEEEHQSASEQLGEDRERYNQFKSAYTTGFPTTLLLEAGEVPVIKSRPQRTLIVAAATVLAFIFCVIGILIFDNYKEVDWKEVYEGKEETTQK